MFGCRTCQNPIKFLLYTPQSFTTICCSKFFVHFAPCYFEFRTLSSLYAKFDKSACAIKDCFVPSLCSVTTALTLSFVLSLHLPSQTQIRTSLRAIACLGLLAVRNSYTPFLFFLRKTALRQVAHRDVPRPHFVRSSHLPKSAIHKRSRLLPFFL